MVTTETTIDSSSTAWETATRGKAEAASDPADVILGDLGQ